MKFFALFVAALIVCGCKSDKPAESVEAAAPVCQNACKDYSTSWTWPCPEGKRCIKFTNNCTYGVGIAYQVGCNGDGTKGAPQCDCTHLFQQVPERALIPQDSTAWVITDGDYTSCTPWKPDCLTEGLAVMVNKDAPSCTSGTRIEFSAGNKADDYGKFDSYNIDTELGFSVPVKFAPDLECANDHANHDCRPLWCDSEKCPDAYANPTQGGCADGRSPQGGCQDTFNIPKGYVVEFCPKDCPDGKCPSCQDAKLCP